MAEGGNFGYDHEWFDYDQDLEEDDEVNQEVNRTQPFEPTEASTPYHRGEEHETAAWLAQLVEHRTAVREVEGSSPRPDQHSGS